MRPDPDMTWSELTQLCLTQPDLPWLQLNWLDLTQLIRPNPTQPKPDLTGPKPTHPDPTKPNLTKPNLFRVLRTLPGWCLPPCPSLLEYWWPPLRRSARISTEFARIIVDFSKRSRTVRFQNKRFRIQMYQGLFSNKPALQAARKPFLMQLH